MLQSENGSPSVPLWSIDRKMTRPMPSHDNQSIGSLSPRLSTSLWDSTPTGKSIYLRLCQREQTSPQLILEDKVFRSAIRLQQGATYRSQLQFVGTLIIDDETQRLTYVIDRLELMDSTTTNHQQSLLPNKQLNGEFIIPIRCDNKTSSAINTDSSLIQEGIKIIDDYCHSSLPIELHQYSFLHGQMSSRLAPSINADLSFDLLTIKNSFKLTPIHCESVQILPTALVKKLSSTTGNGIYANQPHFGYCGLDRMSKDKILLILDNDPQACALPLVGIWVSGIVDVQCAFVWATCLRYCLNSSLKQRLRNGVNAQQSFLLACYSSTSRGQCDFYEVTSTSMNTSSNLVIEYDLWTSSKKIIMPNIPTLHSHDASVNIQLPYDFEFRHVFDGPKMHALLGAYTGNTSLPIQQPQTQLQQKAIRSNTNTQFPSDISFLSAEIPSEDEEDDHQQQQQQQLENERIHQATLSSPNTNGSLFGVPRLPPKQSSHQSPSWDSISTTTMTTPKWIAPVPSATLTSPRPPPPLRFSSPAPSTIAPSTSTIATDVQWKEEMLEKMQAYDAHIQSLNALIAQLLATQQQQQQQLQLQQSTMTTPARESIKCDVAVQSEPPSPCPSDDIGESASMVKSNRNSPPSTSPKIEQYQQQTPIMTTNARVCVSLSNFFLFLLLFLFQSHVPSMQFQSPQQQQQQQVVIRQPEPIIDYASLRKSADSDCLIVENTPIRTASSAPQDLNPVDILKPFFQFMATQQHKQQQNHQKSASPMMTSSKSFDTPLIQAVDEDSTHQSDKMSQLANAIQQQQQQVTSTTTTGISFISNGLQMQIINQQSSTTTVYPSVSSVPLPGPPPPLATPTASAPIVTEPASPVNCATSLASTQQSDNDLSIEVRSLQMKYLDDDQLANSNDYDRQSPTPPSTVRQSPQTFDKNMSFATQKYFQKYNILSGCNRPQQHYYLSSDDSDLLASSSPPQQRMLLSFPPPPASPPVFTQPPAPHAPQAKILDLSQIRKLPKLL